MGRKLNYLPFAAIASGIMGVVARAALAALPADARNLEREKIRKMVREMEKENGATGGLLGRVFAAGAGVKNQIGVEAPIEAEFEVIETKPL